MLEFNKVTRRIILSHSRVYEDEQRAEQRKAAAPRKAAETPEIQNQAAANSLADNDALAELKAKLAEQSNAE